MTRIKLDGNYYIIGQNMYPAMVFSPNKMDVHTKLIPKGQKQKTKSVNILTSRSGNHLVILQQV
jgi:hypothetical protein